MQKARRHRTKRLRQLVGVWVQELFHSSVRSAFHLSLTVFHFIYFINVAVLLPRYCRNNNGLGLSPVARRYWGNHVCFLLLQVLRCFSSLRLPTLRYNMSSTYWVFPFGDLRIKGYLHLNGAFRSLSRPSSPLRA